MEAVLSLDNEIFDRKTWKTDPNAYARNYYKEKNNVFVPCPCCKILVKKLTIAKHNKCKKHLFYLTQEDNRILKERLEKLQQN